jgi:hypothetical protein
VMEAASTPCCDTDSLQGIKVGAQLESRMWFGFAFRMAHPACTLMNQTNRQPLAVGLASTYDLATTESYFSLSACSMYEADVWLSPTVERR